MEQIDTLKNGYKIIQDSESFQFGIDAILLADFAAGEVKNGDAVIDLGTGTGIIPLLMEKRCEDLKDAKFTGLEIQKASADMAARSVKLNDLENRISIVNGDIKNPEFAMELYNTCIEMANEIDVHDDRILGPVYLRIARMYHYGIGTNQDTDMALKMYHKAEMHLYQLITEFYDFRFIQSYDEARSGLETITDDLNDEIPVFEW